MSTNNDRYEKQGLTGQETVLVDDVMTALQEELRGQMFLYYGDDRIERVADAVAVFVRECRPLNREEAA